MITRHDRSESAPEAEEQRAALALALLPSITSHQKAKLVRHCGSCARALAYLPEPVPPQILRRAEKELKGCERNHFSVLCLSDPRYPALLKEIADPPPVLYVWGVSPWNDSPSLAVVGSRRATPYGAEVCERLAAELAVRGLTIVSGLARGIDGIAHRAALDAGGKTVAVLGSGLDVIYPREHRRLAERIVKSAAVISEFPLTSPPLPGHFPRRNRIISGLCWGTVVIEAAERSGSLITARTAADQNREVFAVPGPIGSPTSGGVHRLIQDGAKLVTETEDVIDELRPELREMLSPAACGWEDTPGCEPLDDGEQQVLRALVHLGSADVDHLVVRSKVPANRLTAALVGLELKGAVRSYPGGIYRPKNHKKWPTY